jgi:hypothetical protein
VSHLQLPPYDVLQDDNSKQDHQCTMHDATANQSMPVNAIGLQLIWHHMLPVRIVTDHKSHLQLLTYNVLQDNNSTGAPGTAVQSSCSSKH